MSHFYPMPTNGSSPPAVPYREPTVLYLGFCSTAIALCLKPNSQHGELWRSSRARACLFGICSLVAWAAAASCQAGLFRCGAESRIAYALGMDRLRCSQKSCSNAAHSDSGGRLHPGAVGARWLNPRRPGRFKDDGFEPYALQRCAQALVIASWSKSLGWPNAYRYRAWTS
jgi:hypothetical protein